MIREQQLGGTRRSMILRCYFVLCVVLAGSPGKADEPAPARKVEPRLVLDNRYAAAVRSVNFSRDGTLIVAAGDSTSLNVWDAASGKVLLKPANFPAADRSDHHSVEFSPDGKLLVVSDIYSTVRFWDIDKRQVVGTLEDCAWGGVFSPDGKSFVTPCGAAGVKVWSAATRKELATLKAPDKDKVACVAYAPNGRFIVFGTEYGKIYGRLTDDFDKPPFLILHHKTKEYTTNKEVASVTISGNSELLASVNCNEGIIVWNTNGKKLYKLDGKLCVFTADSRFLLLARSDGFVVYDAATGAKRAEVETKFRDLVHAVTISADGKLIAVGYDNGTVRVWDMKDLLAAIK